MRPRLHPWSVRAVNLPEHRDNPVHTVEGGTAAGYGGAVVAGTTIYAYLTRPVLAAWGEQWPGSGTAEVRFRAPVLADDLVEIDPRPDEGDAWVLEARSNGKVRASLRVGLGADGPPECVGERLEPFVEVLDDRWTGYAHRAGVDVDVSASTMVHPVVWISLANRLFARELVDGPWVHTRSAVRHLSAVTAGATAVVEGWVVDRFATQAGARAVVDVRITVDGELVAVVEHEAIIGLVAG